MTTSDLIQDGAMVEEVLHGLRLDDTLFNENELTFDLREGVIWNPAKTRICVLSADLISGVYRALLDEAGPAWKYIFKNCGRIWGSRVARRLDREYQVMAGRRLGEMPLEDYLQFITNYFVFHGWGTLTIEASRAREAGLIEATLRDSLFAEVIPQTEEMVDPMIAGILASLFAYMSGHDLDCVQTSCTTKNSPVSTFIITGGDRLKTVEDQVRAGTTHESLVATI